VTKIDPNCHTCVDRKENGRKSEKDPIHCHRCHGSWTGNEAQHCVVCCTTFYSIKHADLHVGKGGHIDPRTTADWFENRPNVWVYRDPTTQPAYGAGAEGLGVGTPFAPTGLALT
jgi:hypothetical protein